MLPVFLITRIPWACQVFLFLSIRNSSCFSLLLYFPLSFALHSESLSQSLCLPTSAAASAYLRCCTCKTELGPRQSVLSEHSSLDFKHDSYILEHDYSCNIRLQAAAAPDAEVSALSHQNVASRHSSDLECGYESACNLRSDTAGDSSAAVAVKIESSASKYSDGSLFPVKAKLAQGSSKLSNYLFMEPQPWMQSIGLKIEIFIFNFAI